MKILLTAFRPLHGWPSNTSEILLTRMESSSALPAFADVSISTTYFSSSCRTLRQELETIVSAVEPDVCLCLGQARGRAVFCLEQVAINVLDMSAPDARGERPENERIRIDGPAAYFQSLPDLERLVEKLISSGIPAKISHFAGTSLCNQLLYEIHHLRELGICRARAGFLHLPLLPEQVRGEWAESPSMAAELQELAIRSAIEHTVFA